MYSDAFSFPDIADDETVENIEPIEANDQTFQCIDEESTLCNITCGFADCAFSTCTSLLMYTTLDDCTDLQVGSNDQRFYVCIATTISNIASSCIVTFGAETLLTIC